MKAAENVKNLSFQRKGAKLQSTQRKTYLCSFNGGSSRPLHLCAFAMETGFQTGAAK